MSEHPPLVRQWILLRTLSARHYGASVRDMAAELNVSDKTIRRDLETFIEAGFPLQESVLDHGKKAWRLSPEKNQPGLGFAWDEAVALYLGRQFMEPLAGTPFWTAAQAAFRKLRSVLGDAALKYLEKFAPLFHSTTVGIGDYSKKAAIIDALMVGIEDRKAVFVTYQSLQATEPVTYDIYPYGLIYHFGSLYLVGFAPDHRQIRHWKVDRVEDAEVTEVHFTRPDEFDLEKHLEKSFGVFHGDGDVCVKVRFSPTVARYVQESRWHRSQKLTCEKDGALVAEFRLSSTEEIKRWILSFGKEATVLEPAALRHEMLSELDALMRTYGGGRDGSPSGMPMPAHRRRRERAIR